MDLINAPKEGGEPGGLRLVPEQRDAQKFPALQKQFVNFMFFRVSPEWRKLDAETKMAFKKEFEEVYKGFSDDLLLFSYSLVGFDSKADLMLWRIGNSLDLIQEMTAKLYRTNVGSFLETADNYLSITKKAMFVTDSIEDRFHVNAGEKKYHFLYPCAKHKEGQGPAGEERDALVEENFMLSRESSPKNWAGRSMGSRFSFCAGRETTAGMERRWRGYFVHRAFWSKFIFLQK